MSLISDECAGRSIRGRPWGQCQSKFRITIVVTTMDTALNLRQQYPDRDFLVACRVVFGFVRPRAQYEMAGRQLGSWWLRYALRVRLVL